MLKLLVRDIDLKVKDRVRVWFNKSSKIHTVIANENLIHQRMLIISSLNFLTENFDINVPGWTEEQTNKWTIMTEKNNLPHQHTLYAGIELCIRIGN